MMHIYIERERESLTAVNSGSALLVKIITESFLDNCQIGLFIPNTLSQPNKTKAKFTQQIPQLRRPNTFAIQFHVNLHVVGLFWQPVFFHI